MTLTSRQLFRNAHPGRPPGSRMTHLTLMEPRPRAAEALRDAFDIKAFHDTVLLPGLFLLTLLEAIAEECDAEILAASF